MLELLLTLLGVAPQQGWMSQYAPDVMRYTVKTRVYDLEHLTREQVMAADVYVAVVDCSRIGEMGWISINGAPYEIYLVADCRGRNVADRWFEENNIIVEVDARTAERHDVLGVGGVRVSMIPDHVRFSKN